MLFGFHSFAVSACFPSWCVCMCVFKFLYDSFYWVLRRSSIRRVLPSFAFIVEAYPVYVQCRLSPTKLVLCPLVTTHSLRKAAHLSWRFTVCLKLKKNYICSLFLKISPPTSSFSVFLYTFLLWLWLWWQGSLWSRVPEFSTLLIHKIFILIGNYVPKRASLVAQRLNCLPAVRETWVRSLGREDTLEKEMATHSSILAWRIPRTEEPGGVQSTGSQRVGHDCVTSLHCVPVITSKTLNSDFFIIKPFWI